MKIKNIVFDLGGVLIDFKPQLYLEHIGFDKNDVQLFYKIVFCGEEWNMYNKSIYSEEDVRINLIQHYPEYKTQINKIFDNIDYSYILFLKKDTSDYLKMKKNKGYNIYILSDLSVDSFNYNKQFDFFNYIDGGVYSFEIGSTKPSKKNYEELLKKYNLNDLETVFIDDNLENVKMANSLGIKGIQFTTLEDLKKILKTLN